MQVPHLRIQHRQVWALLGEAFIHTMLNSVIRQQVLDTVKQIHDAVGRKLSDTSDTEPGKVFLPPQWFAKSDPLTQLVATFNCICQMCCFELCQDKDFGPNSGYYYELRHDVVLQPMQSHFLSVVQHTLADIMARLECGFALRNDLSTEGGDLFPPTQKDSPTEPCDTQSTGSTFNHMDEGYPDAKKVHASGVLLRSACLMLHTADCEEGNKGS